MLDRSSFSILQGACSVVEKTTRARPVTVALVTFNLVLGMILLISPNPAAGFYGEPCDPMSHDWCTCFACQGIGCFYCGDSVEPMEEGCIDYGDCM